MKTVALFLAAFALACDQAPAPESEATTVATDVPGDLPPNCPQIWYSNACYKSGGMGPAPTQENERYDEHGYPMNQCFTPSTAQNPNGVAIDCIAFSAVSRRTHCVVACD